MIKFELDRSGVRQLMQSEEMMEICQKEADRALKQLGDGYESSSLVGKTRVNVEVAAVSFAAKKENMETNSILKALGIGK